MATQGNTSGSADNNSTTNGANSNESMRTEGIEHAQTSSITESNRIGDSPQTLNADLVSSAFGFQPTAESSIALRPLLVTKDTGSYLDSNIDSGSQPMSQPHQQ